MHSPTFVQTYQTEQVTFVQTNNYRREAVVHGRHVPLGFRVDAHPPFGRQTLCNDVIVSLKNNGYMYMFCIYVYKHEEQIVL